MFSTVWLTRTLIFKMMHNTFGSVKPNINFILIFTAR